MQHEHGLFEFDRVHESGFPFHCAAKQQPEKPAIHGLNVFIFACAEDKLHYNVIHGCAMAANALVQTRIDGKIKREATVVLEAIGLTVSDAVRLMLTRVAREKALPFEPLVPNKETIAAMKEAHDGILETVTLDDLQAMFSASN
jgi:DNA-damage-inducible protein J